MTAPAIDALVAQLADRAGTIGIMQVGSSLRPWADAESDIDLMAIMEDDAHAAIPIEKRHVVGIDRGPPRRKAYEVLLRSWGEVSSYVDSTWDLHHYQYQFARVHFDPQGRLTQLLGRIVVLPKDVRETRLRVHYYEATYYCGKASKCEQRGTLANARITGHLGLYALTRMLFVAQGSWGPLQNWTMHDLAFVGVPTDILGSLEVALLDPRASAYSALFELVDRWLDGKGITFHRAPVELANWAVFDDAGIAATRIWCAFGW